MGKRNLSDVLFSKADTPGRISLGENPSLLSLLICYTEINILILIRSSFPLLLDHGNTTGLGRY